MEPLGRCPTDNATLVDGLAALLDRLGVTRADVMGGSYGGLVAQVFVRRHPQRSANLILSHTLLPDPDTARAVARMSRWMRLVPMPLLRRVFARRMGGLLPKEGVPQAKLVAAHFEEIVRRRLTKAQLLSLLARTVDVSQGWRFAPDDLDVWPGRILLLLAEDDPATPEPLRRALAAMYPRAEVRLFSGGGHATALVKQDEYIAAIEAFLG